MYLKYISSLSPYALDQKWSPYVWRIIIVCNLYAQMGSVICSIWNRCWFPNKSFIFSYVLIADCCCCSRLRDVIAIMRPHSVCCQNRIVFILVAVKIASLCRRPVHIGLGRNALPLSVSVCAGADYNNIAQPQQPVCLYIYIFSEMDRVKPLNTLHKWPKGIIFVMKTEIHSTFISVACLLFYLFGDSSK